MNDRTDAHAHTFDGTKIAAVLSFCLPLDADLIPIQLSVFRKRAESQKEVIPLSPELGLTSDPVVPETSEVIIVIDSSLAKVQEVEIPGRQTEQIVIADSPPAQDQNATKPRRPEKPWEVTSEPETCDVPEVRNGAPAEGPSEGKGRNSPSVEDGQGRKLAVSGKVGAVVTNDKNFNAQTHGGRKHNAQTNDVNGAIDGRGVNVNGATGQKTVHNNDCVVTGRANGALESTQGKCALNHAGKVGATRAVTREAFFSKFGLETVDGKNTMMQRKPGGSFFGSSVTMSDAPSRDGDQMNVSPNRTFVNVIYRNTRIGCIDVDGNSPPPISAKDAESSALTPEKARSLAETTKECSEAKSAKKVGKDKSDQTCEEKPTETPESAEKKVTKKSPGKAAKVSSKKSSDKKSSSKKRIDFGESTRTETSSCTHDVTNVKSSQSDVKDSSDVAVDAASTDVADNIDTHVEAAVSCKVGF